MLQTRQIASADIPDFRDPHMFWNEDIKAWNLILAAGQEMNIYSSKDLKHSGMPR